MKKLLTLAAVAVLILGLAAATHAVELKASGFINNYTAWGVNLNAFQLPAGFPGPDAWLSTTNTGFDDTFAWNNMWSHLTFTFNVSEDLTGIFAFEAGPAIWGTIGTHGGWYPGSTVNLYQASVDFKVPGTDAFPTRAVVGLQPWIFSAPLAIFEYGPGVRFNTTAGPASVSLFWRKHDENTVWQSDDFDSYGLSFGMPAGPVTPSVWSIYYLLRTGANTVAFPTTYDPTGAPYRASGYHWYTGVNVMGKAGPAAINADFVYGMRKIDYNLSYVETVTFGLLTRPALRSGEDNSGWVFRAKASVPVSMLTAGAEFMYGSAGDDQDWAFDREWGGYQYPIPATGGINVACLGDAALVYYRSYSHVWPGLTGQAGSDWYVKGFASVKPLDWLTVTFNALYIADNVENGDKLGDSVSLLGIPEDNDDIGIEIDLITRLQIYDNLAYEIGAGYLMAGSALDRNIPGTNFNESPKDPWVLLSNLSFFF